MKSTQATTKKKLLPGREVQKKSFPIVAIGASAGGLEAVSVLLKNVSPETGMAFFYVQHLSPDHPSNLASILSSITKMKVQDAANNMRIEPNNLYICVPNTEMVVAGGKIKLIPRKADELPYLPIDKFFISLVEDYKENVIGIILSGSATDGTKGFKAIRDAGGLTFAQDSSAKYSSMPKSAIGEDIVDFVLSPKEIARELTRFSKKGFMRSYIKSKGKEAVIEYNDPDLKKIFGVLHKETGVDFSHYKMTTIKRRLNHRMLRCDVKKIKEYLKLLLKKKNEEVDLLYKDLLINVTDFFRDMETFRYLQTTFLPKLLKSKLPDKIIRIWVPACSTGEEAYSIAMLILELQDNKTRKIPVQIFCTDLSEQAIRQARIGEYSQSQMKPVSKKRAARFFTKTGDNYRIVKELREMCMFAPHNILRDPPFSRMDFISCRNLLIYFDVAAQKKAISTFHFALNEGGYLLLGKSETIETSSHLFTQINNNFKIYSPKKDTSLRKLPELEPRFPRHILPEKSVQRKTNIVPHATNLDSTIDSVLLSRYVPACAIINKEMEILQFRGSTELYLRHSSGKASLNILKMARSEFAFELRNAIHHAFKTKKTIRKSGIEMRIDSTFRKVSIEASTLKIEWEEPLLLIVFTLEQGAEKYPADTKAEKSNSRQKGERIKKLVEELSTVRAEMHSYIEAQEVANEELQSANEEITSASEEFQTLNEELETSKEEIEAANEELTTTNQELRMRNDMVAEAYDYSEAIIATIHEPMVILDKHLCVKSANAAFYKKFSISVEETKGISLFKLSNKQWDIPALHQLLGSILSKNAHFHNFEVTLHFPNIGERVMLLNASQIIQKTHREQLILLAIEDITVIKRKQMEEKELLHKDIRSHEADKLVLEKAVKHRTRLLQQKNAELETANKDLMSFTYVSSHDLQEPLRKIQNFVSCMLDEEREKLSDDGKHYLQRTYETAKRMQTLIEDLLAYSRTKNAERKLEKVNLNIILDEVKKDFEEVIHEKKATIVSNKLCEIPVIPFQFRQLMHNLIGNSLKFSKQDRPLRITIKSEIVDGSKLKKEELSPKISYCHLSITDNGVGFDSKYKDRIFEVFQRLHSFDEYKGTGVGLAICKRIVENHNGIITAAGKLNKGARYDIYIPV